MNARARICLEKLIERLTKRLAPVPTHLIDVKDEEQGHRGMLHYRGAIRHARQALRSKNTHLIGEAAAECVALERTGDRLARRDATRRGGLSRRGKTTPQTEKVRQYLPDYRSMIERGIKPGAARRTIGIRLEREAGIKLKDRALQNHFPSTAIPKKPRTAK